MSVSVAGRPGILVLGLLAGGLVGALAGVAGGLAFVRSPAAPIVVPVAAVAILVMWSIASGAAALASVQRAEGRSGRILPAIATAGRRAPALMLGALPVFAALAALVAAQFALFFLTRPPEAVIADDRPIAVVAVVFVLLFLVDALALAAANAALWLLFPYVANGDGPVAAYAHAREAFWRRPGWTVGMMAGVLAIASAVSTALVGILAVALVVASSAQLLGANELVLLRFSMPLVQGSFIIPTGDFAAVVIMATGLGAGVGGAVGFGHMFGVAGGVGLRRANEPAGGEGQD